MWDPKKGSEGETVGSSERRKKGENCGCRGLHSQYMTTHTHKENRKGDIEHPVVPPAKVQDM